MSIRAVTGLVYNLCCLVGLVAGFWLFAIHPALVIAPFVVVLVVMYACFAVRTARALTWVRGKHGMLTSNIPPKHCHRCDYADRF